MPSDIVNVHANWTAQNERRIAQPEPMHISGIISGDKLNNLNDIYPVEKPIQTSPSDGKNMALGHCYCGNVQLGLPLSIEAAISVICHCRDCREWHSVGSLPYMMFPLETRDGKEGDEYHVPIKLFSSPEDLAYVHRTPEVRRYYAKCCGTRLFNSVFNDKLGLRLCGTFPTVFPNFQWVPKMHVNLREGNDLDYPLLNEARWADLPGAFGGTGKQIPT